MKLVAAMVAGFLTSAILQQRLHEPDAPELLRYGVGGILIVACYAILHPGDEAGLQRVFVSSACAGLGVALARLWDVLTEAH